MILDLDEDRLTRNIGVIEISEHILTKYRIAVTTRRARNGRILELVVRRLSTEVYVRYLYFALLKL